MKNEKIMASDLAEFGPVVQTIFRGQYPNGLTLEELKMISVRHGWARRILAGINGPEEAGEE